MPGCCSEARHSLAAEFQLQKLSLVHYPVEDFYKSQWQKGRRSFWWLLWRWFAAGFFTVAVVLTCVRFFGEGTYFIYLTDWGFIMCMVTTIYGAVLATMWHFGYSKKGQQLESSTSVKVYWALHWITLIMAVVITTMYWAFLFPSSKDMGADPYNLMQHACNSVVMLIDHMVVAFPSRILHFIYPFGFGVVYMIFSLVYFFCGGTDIFGNTAIYPILDWDESPGMAVATVVISMVMSFIFSFLLFYLYKLRKWIHRECFNTQSPHVIPR